MSDIQQIYTNPSLDDDPNYSDDQQEELAQYQAGLGKQEKFERGCITVVVLDKQSPKSSFN